MINPIFESAGSWDLLCDIGTGRMVVHKDIHASWPVGPVPSAPTGPGGVTRMGTIRGEPPVGVGVGGSEEEVGRTSTQINTPLPGGKGDFSGKADSPDNIFMDDVSVLPPFIIYYMQGIYC